MAQFTKQFDNSWKDSNGSSLVTMKRHSFIREVNRIQLKFFTFKPTMFSAELSVAWPKDHIGAIPVSNDMADALINMGAARLPYEDEVNACMDLIARLDPNSGIAANGAPKEAIGAETEGTEQPNADVQGDNEPNPVGEDTANGTEQAPAPQEQAKDEPKDEPKAEAKKEGVDEPKKPVTVVAVKRK